VNDVYELAGILKANGSVAASKRSEGQPAAMNVASHLLTETFGGSGVRGRSGVGVPSLPDGTPVELVVSLGA
jgi:hypothetical protein